MHHKRPTTEKKGTRSRYYTSCVVISATLHNILTRRWRPLNTTANAPCPMRSRVLYSYSPTWTVLLFGCESILTASSYTDISCRIYIMSVCVCLSSRNSLPHATQQPDMDRIEPANGVQLCVHTAHAPSLSIVLFDALSPLSREHYTLNWRVFGSETHVFAANCTLTDNVSLI